MELFVSNATKVFPKVVCVGKNYLKHVKEMGGSEVPTTPVIFLKPWSSVNYNPSTLALPSSAFHRVDHELELGVYISKGGKNIAKEDAMSHVGGYFIGIDFTDRGNTQDKQISRMKLRPRAFHGHWPNARITSVPSHPSSPLILTLTQLSWN